MPEDLGSFFLFFISEISMHWGTGDIEDVFGGGTAMCLGVRFWGNKSRKCRRIRRENEVLMMHRRDLDRTSTERASEMKRRILHLPVLIQTNDCRRSGRQSGARDTLHFESENQNGLRSEDRNRKCTDISKMSRNQLAIFKMLISHHAI